MNGRYLSPADTTYLDTLFGWPLIHPVPSAALREVPPNDLAVWCLKRAIYQVPTLELINYLKHEIGDPASSLEIGAGNGQIGRHLGIRMTDSRMQEWPSIRTLYAQARQPTVQYGADVEALPALTAVAKYQPSTVLGCWVTEKYLPGKSVGNMHGIDEGQMLRFPGVKKYILVGNWLTHGDKQILATVPHRTHHFDWLFSRSVSKDQNCIVIFTPSATA